MFLLYTDNCYGLLTEFMHNRFEARVGGEAISAAAILGPQFGVE